MQWRVRCLPTSAQSKAKVVRMLSGWHFVPFECQPWHLWMPKSLRKMHKNCGSLRVYPNDSGLWLIPTSSAYHCNYFYYWVGANTTNPWPRLVNKERGKKMLFFYIKRFDYVLFHTRWLGLLGIDTPLRPWFWAYPLNPNLEVFNALRWFSSTPGGWTIEKGWKKQHLFTKSC